MMIQDLITKLKGLEDREADHELRIAVQEDTIQILSAKVEELKGKMCRCQDSPRISQGSGQAESPYELEGEQPEASSSSDESRLWPIQGGERRGEMATPEIDPNDVGPSVPFFTSRVFSDDVVIEGPYHPASAATTLVEIPNDLPELEDVIPIMVPPVHLFFFGSMFIALRQRSLCYALQAAGHRIMGHSKRPRIGLSKHREEGGGGSAG